VSVSFAKIGKGKGALKDVTKKKKKPLCIMELCDTSNVKNAVVKSV
jgi:hypothetical protein